MPPSSFAALTTHDVDISPTLRISVIDGEDGARFPSARTYVDRTRDLPCAVRFTDDGASRCAPMAGYRYTPGKFTDIECATPAAAIHCTFSTCNYAIAFEPYGSCPDDRARFYQLGSTVDRSRERSGPDCQWSQDDDGLYAEVRSPIDAATFPAVELRKGMHTRLVDRTLLVNGTPVEQSAIFDPQFEDDCRFEQAGDGKYRCLPAHAAAALQRYADANCTKPAFWVDASCSRTSKYGRIVEGDPCNPRTRIYELLPAGKGFTKAGPGGSCVPSGFEETLFAQGGEIPPTSFVEGYSAMR